MLAFRVLTKRNWKDAQGERQEASETHHVTIFGTFAEYAHRNMIEGGKVMVEGEAETLSWLSEETGQQMTRQHVRCRTLLFL